MAADLKPMGIGDIFDATFKLYKNNFVNFMTIAMIVFVPWAIMNAGFIALMGITPGQAPAPGDEGMVLASALFFMVGVFIFAFVLMPMMQGALINSISANFLGSEKLSAMDCYKRAAPRVPRLIGANIMAGLIILIGFILLIVPGVIFSLWYMLITAVVMLEKTTASGSLSRSKELMSGNLGKGFLVGLVIVLIQIGLGMAIAPLQVALVEMPAVSTFIEQIVSALFVPIQMAPVILLYYDLRIRKEGFDLQMLSESVGLEVESDENAEAMGTMSSEYNTVQEKSVEQ